jgi:Lon protease-like protein
MLTDKMLDLNIFELRYLALSMKNRVAKTSGINPLKLNMDWPSIK